MVYTTRHGDVLKDLPEHDAIRPHVGALGEVAILHALGGQPLDWQPHFAVGVEVKAQLALVVPLRLSER